MADRLTTITTRLGDDGFSSLGTGDREIKSAKVFDLLGDLDELNAHVGMCKAMVTGSKGYQKALERIQHDLFDIGAEVCTGNSSCISNKRLAEIDSHLAWANGALPPLKEFVLPGSTTINAQLHITRTVARRAERSYVNYQYSSSSNTLKYLNRLSDLLFLWARCLSRANLETEVTWER